MKLFSQLGWQTIAATTGLALAIGWGQGTHYIQPALAEPGHHNPGPMTPHEDGHDALEHGHGMVEIPDGQPVPSVNLVVTPDPVLGWNLEIQTTNFRFAPEHVNQVDQPGEGHGHLYINGEKISRVYGPWLHISSLPRGRNEITVGLNTNGHGALAHNGEMIESTVVVEVP